MTGSHLNQQISQPSGVTDGVNGVIHYVTCVHWRAVVAYVRCGSCMLDAHALDTFDSVSYIHHLGFHFIC